MFKVEDLMMIRDTEYKGELNWRANLWGDNSWLFIHKEEGIVAEIVLLDDFSCMKVDDFEVRPEIRKNGIGRVVIKLCMDYALEQDKKGLTGESTDFAMPFWSKLGADLEIEDEDDECFNCDNNCEECSLYNKNEVNLTPFILKSRSFYSYYASRVK